MARLRRSRKLHPEVISGRWGLVDGDWVALLPPFSEHESEDVFDAAVASLARTYPDAGPLYSEERERARKLAVGERLREGRCRASRSAAEGAQPKTSPGGRPGEGTQP